jgi:ABC-type multidrug transport system fused ATPase/permease subunit
MNIFSLIYQYKRHFVLLILLVIFEGLVAAGSVVFLIPLSDFLIDTSLSNASSVTLYINKILFYFSIYPSYFIYATLFIVFNFGNSILKVFIKYSSLHIKYVVLRDLNKRSLNSFFNSRMEFFDSIGVGILANTLLKELPTIGAALGQMSILVAQIFQLFIYLMLPFLIAPKLTILTFVLASTLAIPFFFLNKMSYRLGKINTETANDSMGIMSELIQSARVIIAYALQRKSKSRYIDAFDKHIDATMKSQLLSTALPAMYTPIGIFSAILALGLSIDDGVKISEIAAVMWSLLSIVPIVSEIIRSNVTINNFKPSYEQLQNLTNESIKYKDGTSGVRHNSFDDRILLKDVIYKHPGRDNGINKLSMSIKKGEFTAIVGQSGSGKSTIIDLILGLKSPSSGTIKIDGISISEMNINSFREKVGYVSQDPILFHMSIKDNLLWANNNASDEKIIKVLKMANAYDFVNEFPDKLNTIVGDRGVLLSGGQRQRVALARALIRDPDLLILDEATSALDTASEELIQDSINNLRDQISIVFVAHRLSTIYCSHYVYVIDDGFVAEEGVFSELSNDRESKLYAMLSKQNQSSVDKKI